MIKELIKLANHLDQKGLTKEADFIDSIIKKSQESNLESALKKCNEKCKSCNSAKELLEALEACGLRFSAIKTKRGFEIPVIEHMDSGKTIDSDHIMFLDDLEMCIEKYGEEAFFSDY